MDCEEKLIRGTYSFGVLIVILVVVCIFVPSMSGHTIGLVHVVATALIAYPLGLLCGSFGISAINSPYTCLFVAIVTGIGSGSTMAGILYMFLFVIFCAVGEQQANNAVCEKLIKSQKHKDRSHHRKFRKYRKYRRY